MPPKALHVAEAVRLALAGLPEGPERAALAAAIERIGRQFGARSCRSIKAGEIGAWLLRWPRLDRERHGLLRRAWALALAPAGVTAPVPAFEELVPEAEPLPMEGLWREPR